MYKTTFGYYYHYGHASNEYVYFQKTVFLPFVPFEGCIIQFDDDSIDLHLRQEGNSRMYITYNVSANSFLVELSNDKIPQKEEALEGISQFVAAGFTHDDEHWNRAHQYLWNTKN